MPRSPFRRSVEVPAEVLDRLRSDEVENDRGREAAGDGGRRHGARLGKDEKILAATAARDATWLLGTRDALVLAEMGPAPGEMGPAPGEMGPVPGEMGPVPTKSARVPWERIETADWDREAERLTVVEVGEFGRVRPTYTFELDHPGRLLELIRERVTASVVLQRRVAVSGKTGLSVVARRPPNRGGEITWAFELDPGIDPDDPAVAEAARRGLETASEELGLWAGPSDPI